MNRLPRTAILLRVATILLALLVACDRPESADVRSTTTQRDGSIGTTPLSTETTLDEGAARITVAPNPAAAGQEVRLVVSARGTPIVWGALVRMTSSGSPSTGDSFVLIGVPPSETTGDPQSYRASEKYEVNDIAYTDDGELRLLVPEAAVSGEYVLELQLASRTAGGSSSIARTKLLIV